MSHLKDLGNSTQTLRKTNVSLSGSAGSDELLTNAGFTDSDNSTTGVDGILIPMYDRNIITQVSNSSPATITTATELQRPEAGPRRFRVTLSAAIDIQRKHTVHIGDFGTPTYVGRFEVVKISDTPAPQTLEIDAWNSNDVNMVAGDLVGEGIFGVLRLAGQATLGVLSMILAIASSADTLRAALLYTTKPSTGDTFTTREANGEVLWSRVFPTGTSVNVDFSGFQVRTGDEFCTFPPKKAISPADGYEPRLMLAFYDVDGSLGGGPITVDIEITHQTGTLIEQSKNA